MIYLDNAATTFRKPPQVAAAVVRAMEHCSSPGRGGYQAAMNAAEAVFRCRKMAGELFETNTENVVFTMNATHALNAAIHSLVERGDTVVVSGFEHNAVMRPLHAIGADVVVAGKVLFDPEDTIRAFEQALTLPVKAVVCTHVSNVFGYRLPIEQIAELCAERGVPLVVDASQSAGVLPVSMKTLGAAFIGMPGHKGLYGPQGTGILLCAHSVKPLIAGGTGSQSLQFEMPDDLPDAGEAGTHNVPGICGLYEGLCYVRQRTTEKILAYEQMLMNRLTDGFKSIESIRVLAADQSVQTGVLSVSCEHLDCEEFAQRLAERGIAVRAGLHCAPLAHRSAGTVSGGTVRFSVSDFNDEEEIEKVLRQVACICQS